MIICHDPNFRLANYAANNLLLHKDGIHLSEAGTHRLLQNLDVASEHSIASDDRKSTPEHTHRHSKYIQNKRGVSRGGWNNTNKDIEIDNQADRTNINTGPVQDVVTSLAASSVARAVT